MLPLKYRDYNLYQSPYFFKRFNDRKSIIGYNHHYELLKDFYVIFKDPSRSVLVKDTRPNFNSRYCDTFAVFKKEDGKYVAIILKEQDDGYFEMVNVVYPNIWLKDIYDKRDIIRQEIAEQKI